MKDGTFTPGVPQKAVTTDALKRQQSSVSSEMPEFDSGWRMEEWEKNKVAQKTAADPRAEKVEGPTPIPAEDPNAVSPPVPKAMPESKEAAAEPGPPAGPEEPPTKANASKYDKYYHQTFISKIYIAACTDVETIVEQNHF